MNLANALLNLLAIPAVINVDLTSFKQAMETNDEMNFCMCVFVYCTECELISFEQHKMFHNPSFICDWYDFALMDLVSFHTPVYEFRVVFSHSLNGHKALVAFCLFIPFLFFLLSRLLFLFLLQVVQTSHAIKQLT